MKLKDIFNRKVRDEKKKYKFYKLPNYVITSEFLDLFSDEEIRNQIYNYIKNTNIDIETYNNFIELYRSNENLAMDYINYNIALPKQVLDFKDFSASYIVFECINFQKKYGDIVIPYLKKDYDFYRELLIDTEFVDTIGVEFALKFPNEMLEIKEYYPKKLNMKCLSILCNLLKNGYINQYNNAMEILSLKNIDTIFVEMLFKNGFDTNLIQDFINKDIFNKDNCMHRIRNYSSENYRELRNKFFETLYEINIINNDLEKAKVSLFESLFGICDIEYMEQYKKIIKNNKFENMIDIAISLKKCNSISDLNALYNKIDFDSVDFYSELEELCRYDLDKKIFHPSLVSKKTGEDGIDIIDNSTCDLSTFTCLIHGIHVSNHGGNISIAKKIINNPDLWLNEGIDGKKGSNIISCSLVSECDFVPFTGGSEDMLLLGFDKLDDIPIIKISEDDGMTSMSSSYEVKKNHMESYDLPSQMFNNRKNLISKGGSTYHNEIALARQKMIPSFILSVINWNNRNFPINDRMKKWAKEFNIPIVQIDFKIVYERALKELDELINRISQVGCTLEDFKKINLLVHTMNNYKYSNYNFFDLFMNIIDKNLSIGTESLINEILEIKKEYDQGFYKCIISGGLPNDSSVKDWQRTEEQRKKILSNKFKLVGERINSFNQSDSLMESNDAFGM